jgi:ABC-type phosphate/phosphonate transport system substrate-binding protein
VTIASLAMYPFEHLRPSFERLWDNVRARLSFAAPALDWETDPDDASRRDDLVLGQTCGWPLVTDLHSLVHVVGTFDCAVDDAVGGTYRSVLVTSLDADLYDILHRPDLTVAVNAPQSLSGWISLQSVALAEGIALDAVEWTGAHARSLEAIRAGRCHLAAIDAVSWSFLDHSDLHVVGQCPRIPCLPLVTSRASSAAVVDELRGALSSAVGDPEMVDTCATLRIRSFLSRELVDYQGVSELLQLG